MTDRVCGPINEWQAADGAAEMMGNGDADGAAEGYRRVINYSCECGHSLACLGSLSGDGAEVDSGYVTLIRFSATN